MAHNDEATARALVEAWVAEWPVDERPWDCWHILVQRITAALAASRAEGEGRGAALVAALERIRAINFATHNGGQVAWEIADEALTTTAAAARAYEARVRNETRNEVVATLSGGQLPAGIDAAQAAAMTQAHDAKVRAPLEEKIAELLDRIRVYDANVPALRYAAAREAARKERERCDRVLEMHEEAERRWEQKHGDEQHGAIGQRPTDCVQYALRQARLAIRALRDDGPEAT